VYPEPNIPFNRTSKITMPDFIGDPGRSVENKQCNGLRWLTRLCLAIEFKYLSGALANLALWRGILAREVEHEQPK
jgi:hypothetical protein